MNYQRVYSQIIDRARIQNRTKGAGTYYESHHLVPKCVGGSNSKDNRVLLTAREHFICHWLLIRIYPESNSLSFAFWTMCNQKNKHQQSRYRPSSRAYEEAKQASIRAQRGVPSGMLGKKHSEETRQKMSESRRRRPSKQHTPETKEKIRQARLGSKRSKETVEKQANAIRGRKKQPHTEETKLKISLARKKFYESKKNQ